MILTCKEWESFGSFWGNASVNLLAIGLFCAAVLLIWKGLCRLDSWKCCKKQQPEENVDSRYEVLKEFTDAMAILHQTVKSQDKKTVFSRKRYLELKGELVLLKELTNMCFNVGMIEKAIEDKVIIKIAVYFDDIYSQLQDFVPANLKGTLQKK